MRTAKVQNQPSYKQSLWLAVASEQFALGRKIPKTRFLCTVQKMEKRSSGKKHSQEGFYLIKDIHYEETIKLMHALIEV